MPICEECKKEVTRRVTYTRADTKKEYVKNAMKNFQQRVIYHYVIVL